MKSFTFITTLLIWVHVTAQPIPHNTVYGVKPRLAGLVYATNLESFMGKRTRISVTLSGLVTLVTKTKGGWFDIDAGKGKIITAHFKNYGITIPYSLKNHYIIAEGVAEKKFIASASQHFAGDKDNHHQTAKTAPKQSIIFEVSGLRVEK